MSVKAAMTYIRQSQTNARNRRYAVGERLRRTISPIDAPPWRTEAIRLEKSWTPPMKMEPRTIHSSAGSQPNQMPAKTGPTIGPAAEMAEKCCPSSRPAEAGT